MQRYQVSDTLVKKRPTGVNVALDKQLNWNQIVEPRNSEAPPPLESYDQMKASIQRQQSLKPT